VTNNSEDNGQLASGIGKAEIVQVNAGGNVAFLRQRFAIQAAIVPVCLLVSMDKERLIEKGQLRAQSVAYSA